MIGGWHRVGRRLLGPLIATLVVVLLVAGARACVIADHRQEVRLRNDFVDPVIVRRLNGAPDTARTLAPGEALVLRYAGRYVALREIGGLGTPTPSGPPPQPPAPVVLGIFTPEGQPLGRLVLPASVRESYNMCLSAASEPPYRMGGAVRGGRPGVLFYPRGVITVGPPLP